MTAVLSSDLVLPDTADLEVADDPGAQIVLACERAKAWLKAGLDVSIEAIVDTKAQAAALSAFAIQKQLGKDAELAALEVQRRAERGTALAVKRGQQSGAITTRADAGWTARNLQSRGETLKKAKANDYYNTSEERADANALASVPDDDFDAAIEDARTEGNLSRANVVRKVKGQGSAKVPVTQQLDRIEELAATGHHSTQIAKELNTTGENIRMLAKKAGIKIPADDILRGKHNLNATRIVRETVQALDGLAMGVGLIEDFSAVDLTTPEAQEWAASLADAMPVLNRFAKQIKKETTHVLDED